jgi:predicted HAD superfamily Cof-like phosphohydrolase
MTKTEQDRRYALVVEFHEVFKVAPARQWGDVSNAQALARRTLHVEEFNEYMRAGEPVDTLDALVDMEYIAAGTQYLLSLERPLFERPQHSLFHYQQRLADELNKSQLCQQGLTTAVAGLRAMIAITADEELFDFDGAFLEVHRTNMEKLWTPALLDQRPADSTATPVTPGSRSSLHIVKRADGKILKPPGWTPPALARYI